MFSSGSGIAASSLDTPEGPVPTNSDGSDGGTGAVMISGGRRTVGAVFPPAIWRSTPEKVVG